MKAAQVITCLAALLTAGSASAQTNGAEHEADSATMVRRFPVGEKLIFDSNQSAPPAVEIWMMDSDGNNPVVLTTGSGQTSWQPVMGPTVSVPAISTRLAIILVVMFLLLGAFRLRTRSRWGCSTMRDTRTGLSER